MHADEEPAAGKLVAAARFFAGAAWQKSTPPDLDIEGTADEFRAWGIAEAQVQRYLASRQAMEPVEPEPFGLWPGNEKALDLFLAVYGSWRCRGMAGAPMGLDEAAIYSRMQVMQEPHNLELYDDVVAMGRAAASVILKRDFSD